MTKTYNLLNVTLTTFNFNRSHLGMVSQYGTCLLLIALLMQMSKVVESCRNFSKTVSDTFRSCRWLDSNSQPLDYKPSDLAIELTSSKAIAGKELSYPVGVLHHQCWYIQLVYCIINRMMQYTNWINSTPSQQYLLSLLGQWLEHSVYNREVVSSSLTIGIFTVNFSAGTRSSCVQQNHCTSRMRSQPQLRNDKWLNFKSVLICSKNLHIRN